MGCCNNQPDFCKPLKSTSIAKNIVVTDRRHCVRTIEPPASQAIVLYNEFGQVVWADGSADAPICLPALQENTDPVVALLGLTESGCVVQVPITYEPIVTCEGPTLTVPVFEIT